MKSRLEYTAPISIPVRLLILFCAAMIFLFPLAHIMAIKKVLLYLAAILAFHLFYQVLRQKNVRFLTALCVLALLQIWLLIIAFAVAASPLPSLMEWKGQWLPSILYFAIGASLAYALSYQSVIQSSRNIALIVFIPAVLYLIANSAYALMHMFKAGQFLSQLPGISDHKANVGYLISVLEPIMIADILLRLSRNTPLLPVSNRISGIVLMLILFSLFSAGSRNGILIMMMAFLIGGMLAIKELSSRYTTRKVRLAATGLLLLSSLFVTVSYQTDSRWQKFINTVPVAWDIDRQQAWKTGDLSDLNLSSDEEHVEESAYLRIAWAHEGLRLLAAHPWGTEISRNTFYRLESEAYGHVIGRHSHNGWIDLGLNVGFPGLLLWSAFLSVLGYSGWQAWYRERNVLGIALFLLVVMFSIRALLDSTFRDHIIQQFMLVAGLLFSTLCFAKHTPHPHEPSS